MKYLSRYPRLYENMSQGYETNKILHMSNHIKSCGKIHTFDGNERSCHVRISMSHTISVFFIYLFIRVTNVNYNNSYFNYNQYLFLKKLKTYSDLCQLHIKLNINTVFKFLYNQEPYIALVCHNNFLLKILHQRRRL